MRQASRILLLLVIVVLIAPGAASAAAAARVVLDPGHGGSDPGAKGINGLEEKTVNLDIALKVRDELKKIGIDVIMTRETDRYISLADRVAFTNKQNADLFVSIHANWYENAATSGALVLYYDSAYPQASYPASQEMIKLSPVSKALAQTVLSSYIETTGLANRGLVESAVYVVRMGTIPSMLIETAFLSNKQDAALLADDAVRTRMAQGIAKGIGTYIGTPFPDTIGHWAREFIIRMNQKGWLQGDHNLFDPDRPMTRAEFVSLMNRVFGFDTLKPMTDKPASGTQQKSKAFTDLSTTHWAYSEIVKAAQLGILQGYPDGSVKPEAPISREETAYLFYLLMQQKGLLTPGATTDTFRFTDVPESWWSAKAIYALRSKNIITGSTQTEFKPNDAIIRAEMAVILDNYTKLGVKPQ